MLRGGKTETSLYDLFEQVHSKRILESAKPGWRDLG
jgi:hypothetical protein